MRYWNLDGEPATESLTFVFMEKRRKQAGQNSNIGPIRYKQSAIDHGS